MNIKLKYVAVFCLLLLCGCPINLDTEKFAVNKPKNEDLVGKYVPDAETVEWVRGAGQYPKVDTSFELSKDGSFKIVNMPDWWLEPFGKSKGGFISGVGKWEVTKQQEWWELEFAFNSSPARSVPIVGTTVPYHLWFYVGDRDQRAMIFEKKP